MTIEYYMLIASSTFFILGLPILLIKKYQFYSFVCLFIGWILLVTSQSFN